MVMVALRVTQKKLVVVARHPAMVAVAFCYLAARKNKTKTQANDNRLIVSPPKNAGCIPALPEVAAPCRHHRLGG